MTGDDLLLYGTYACVAGLLFVSQVLGGWSFHPSLQPLLMPLYGGIEYTHSVITDTSSYFETREQLLQKIYQLELENRDLREKALRSEALQEKLGKLRRQLKLPDRRPGRLVGGDVIHTNLSDYERTLRVNRGYQSGIQAGSPVIEVQADTWILRGQVFSVGRRHSTVILSSDPRFKIGVRIRSYPERQFVAHGWGYRGLRIDHFPSILDEPGEQNVYTADASSIAPPGIWLGVARGFSTRHKSYPQADRSVRIEPPSMDPPPRVLWIVVSYD